MTDEELRRLARIRPEELEQMILSGVEGQDDARTPQELRESQKWGSRAQSALKEVGWGDT